CITCTTVPGAWSAVCTSNIAWCRLASNFSPIGQMRLTCWRSSAASSWRSVALTPSCRFFSASSAASAAAGMASSARCRLSLTCSTSRAKFVMAYLAASSRSRWARRRTFSASARARSSWSLSCAASCRAAASSWSGPAGMSIPSSTGAASLAGSGIWSLSSIMSRSSNLVSMRGVLGSPHRWSTAKSGQVIRRCGRLAENPADHLGGVVDHRDDAGVVEPAGADDPDRANQLALAVPVGRNDRRAAGEAEQVALRADEDLHPFGLVGGLQQLQQLLLGLERGEQGAQALQIRRLLHVVQQVRLAAHDEGALAALGIG